jgi:hypothetical protein
VWAKPFWIEQLPLAAMETAEQQAETVEQQAAAVEQQAAAAEQQAIATERQAIAKAKIEWDASKSSSDNATRITAEAAKGAAQGATAAVEYAKAAVNAARETLTTAQRATNAARAQYDDLLRQRAFFYSGAFYFSYLRSPIQTAETDAEGKFVIEVPRIGKFVIAAQAKRSVGQETETYYWLQPISLEGQPQHTQNLSNNNLTNATGTSSLVLTQD